MLPALLLSDPLAQWGCQFTSCPGMFMSHSLRGLQADQAVAHCLFSMPSSQGSRLLFPPPGAQCAGTALPSGAHFLHLLEDSAAGPLEGVPSLWALQAFGWCSSPPRPPSAFGAPLQT